VDPQINASDSWLPLSDDVDTILSILLLLLLMMVDVILLLLLLLLLPLLLLPLPLLLGHHRLPFQHQSPGSAQERLRITVI
jgi:hypothetical protein